MDPELQTAICAVPLPGEPPEWIQIMPLGGIVTTDGRAFNLADAEAVIAASTASKVDLVIDFDHATDVPGSVAPAAGWIKELAVQEGFITARVEWTPTGAERIRNREYRYISPTFRHGKNDGRVQRILRAALVNAPAIHELAAVASENHGDTMDETLKALLEALGLAEDADQATAVARVGEIASAAAVAKATREALGLDEGADGEAVATAIASAKSSGEQPDPNPFVPRSEFDRVSDRLTQLETATADEKTTAAVDSAIEDGKVAVGRAEEQVDNGSGAAGDLNVPVRAGVFRWANSAAADEITKAEIGDDCYIVDDQTVAKTDGTGTRSKAGTVVDVDAQGVWVRTGLI